MQVNSKTYKQLTFFALILMGVSTLIGYLLYLLFAESFSKLPVFIQLIVSIPTVPAIYALLFFLFNKYLWKLRLFKFFGIVVSDNLNGKWKGIIKSSWDEFKSDIPCELIIKQTATTIKICGKFNQSRSVSIHEHFGRSEGLNQTVLYYFYENDPNYDAPATMAMHEGSTILTYHKEDDSLSGYYYSGRDRNNHGTIKVTRV